MFNTNQLYVVEEKIQEAAVNPTAFKEDQQTLYSSNMNVEHFGFSTGWSPLEENVVQFPQSFTSLPTQPHQPTTSNQESVACSSNGTMKPSLLKLEPFPNEDKVLDQPYLSYPTHLANIYSREEPKIGIPRELLESGKQATSPLSS